MRVPHGRVHMGCETIPQDRADLPVAQCPRKPRRPDFIRSYSQFTESGNDFCCHYRRHRTEIKKYNQQAGADASVRGIQPSSEGSRRWTGSAATTDRHESHQEKLTVQMGLLDLTQDALIIRDLEDRIEAWNRGAERLYGWSAAEALGKNIQDLLR